MLHPGARPPTVSFPGSDLGYDLYAIEDAILQPGVPVKLRTGIALEGPPGCGFVLGDRSSMAAKGITYAGGRIDAGYRGEILVCLINVNQPAISLSLRRNNAGHITDATLLTSDVSVPIRKGDKIIQLSPFYSLTTWQIVIVEELSSSERGNGGFGSTGR
ncbi:MAG TPA: dUTP diphosphatase [Acidisarcina sp.]